MLNKLMLVCGKPATGKSVSLRNMADNTKVLYLCTEAGKALPFKAKFIQKVVTDPYQLIGDSGYIAQAAANPDKIDTVVIDSITYLMSMFEQMYVNTSSDTRKAWGEYASYFKTLMLTEIPKLQSSQKVIITAHTADIYNERELALETLVKLKGSVMNEGVESYFTNIVSTKRVPLAALNGYENKYLNITEDDKIEGFKYVFQTRLTADTVNERIRQPFNMWSRSETYIDNDLNYVIERLEEYYKD